MNSLCSGRLFVCLFCSSPTSIKNMCRSVLSFHGWQSSGLCVVVGERRRWGGIRKVWERVGFWHAIIEAALSCFLPTFFLIFSCCPPGFWGNAAACVGWEVCVVYLQLYSRTSQWSRVHGRRLFSVCCILHDRSWLLSTISWLWMWHSYWQTFATLKFISRVLSI